MGSNSKMPSLSRPPKGDSLLLSSQNPQNPSSAPDPIPNPLSSSIGEDSILIDSEFLSREEVLRRRSRRVKQLEKYYRDQYWALVDEVRAKHREYYWSYGFSPMEVDSRVLQEEEEQGLENGGVKMRGRSRCAFGGCKSKAMPLTRFCHPHILADGEQTLYKGCAYVLRSTQTGPIVCGKPILRSTVPSFCPTHFQKSQKYVSQSLKKAGINVCSSTRPTMKSGAIILEFVYQIQGKRTKALAERKITSNATVEDITDKDSKIG